MNKNLDPSWLPVLQTEFEQDYFRQLETFVDRSRQTTTVYPNEQQVFRAFQLTPFDKTKVVILGQDPYHDEGQAHGLAFSVQSGTAYPPSLRNIFQELVEDLGVESPVSGDLTRWAQQGVLLLNTVMTVEAHRAHSHQKQGWERFTDNVIERLGTRQQHTVFILWGKPAQTKARLIDSRQHTVIGSPHPSPLAAYRGFFGSRPFFSSQSGPRRQRTNDSGLVALNRRIHWWPISVGPGRCSTLDCLGVADIVFSM